VRKVALALPEANERPCTRRLLACQHRVPFHCHAGPYFFVCIDGGRGLSRFPDGNAMTIEYGAGDTWFDEVGGGPEIHDLENVGDSRLRFTTVELLA
jgi:hypothetical protein